MKGPERRQIEYMASTLKEIKKLPPDVREVFLAAFDFAANGEKHPDAEPMKGYHGAGVLEVRDDGKDVTFRAVYTTNYDSAIYVLHIYKKKSTTGIAIPRTDKRLIDKRLKDAKRIHDDKKAMAKGPSNTRQR